MSYFLGEYECKLDAKGRLVLPARMKSKLPQAAVHTVVITHGLDECLKLYPETEFKTVYDQIAALNEFDNEARLLKRNILYSAHEAELDNLGRFLIPARMQQYAGLQSDVIVVGVGNAIEIWDPTRYKEQIKSRDEFSALAQKYLGGRESGG